MDFAENRKGVVKGNRSAPPPPPPTPPRPSTTATSPEFVAQTLDVGGSPSPPPPPPPPPSAPLPLLGHPTPAAALQAPDSSTIVPQPLQSQPPPPPELHPPVQPLARRFNSEDVVTPPVPAPSQTPSTSSASSSDEAMEEPVHKVLMAAALMDRVMLDDGMHPLPPLAVLGVHETGPPDVYMLSPSCLLSLPLEGETPRYLIPCVLDAVLGDTDGGYPSPPRPVFGGLRAIHQFLLGLSAC